MVSAIDEFVDTFAGQRREGAASLAAFVKVMLRSLPDDREGETVTAERAWSDALEAVAWCLDSGESSVDYALAYVAKNNPHAAPAAPDGGDQ